MRTKYLITLLSLLMLVPYLRAQVVEVIDVSTPGTLASLLGSKKTTVTDLTLTGTINAIDFTTIKQMTALKDLNLYSVNLTNGKLPNEAFKQINLNRIVLPISLKGIGDRAFLEATVSELDFSQCVDLEEIGSNVFNRIVLANRLLDFSNCEKLNSFNKGNYTTGAFAGCSAHVKLPRTLLRIHAAVFQRFWGTLELHEGLEKIGVSAFAEAVLKEKLVFPSTLKLLETNAFIGANVQELDFSQCVNLEELRNNVFDKTVFVNRLLDFSNCSKLNTFNKNNYTSGAFTGCTGHVKLPRTLLRIHATVFDHFEGTVDLHEGLEQIGVSAFYGATLKEKLVFPSSLKMIEEKAFWEAKIPALDFSRCVNLEELHANIFVDATFENRRIDFSNCGKLNSFNKRRDNLPIEGTFTKCTGHVILAPHIIQIPARTFQEFQGSVVLHEGITSIGSYAFQGSTLSDGIILPNSLQKIGDYAFQNSTIPYVKFADKQGVVSCF